MTLIEIAEVYTDLVNAENEIPQEDFHAKEQINTLRTKYHNLLMDHMTREGIYFSDRFDATSKAFEIVRKGLELFYANIFCDWLNDNYGCDYKAKINFIQNSDVDVFGISRSNLPELNLQLVASDTVEHKLAQSKVEIMDGAKVKVHAGAGNFDAIPNAIIEKEDKKYSNPADLILIIQSTFPTPQNLTEIISNLSQKTSMFRGVYYIQRSHDVLEDNGWANSPHKIHIIKDAGLFGAKLPVNKF